MCIRDSFKIYPPDSLTPAGGICKSVKAASLPVLCAVVNPTPLGSLQGALQGALQGGLQGGRASPQNNILSTCLLYPSDAADDLTRVDVGGRRIIKQTKTRRDQQA